jgi:hypothetical protein
VRAGLGRFIDRPRHWNANPGAQFARLIREPFRLVNVTCRQFRNSCVVRVWIGRGSHAGRCRARFSQDASFTV